MAKRYLGFAIRIKEQEKGIIFKRTEKKEVFSRITVGDVENLAEAQKHRSTGGSLSQNEPI